MADFVGDHVGLREVARRAELVAQRLVEAKIDVHLAILGTVERAHRALAGTAGGRYRAAKQHQPRPLIGAAGLREDVAPYVFGAGEYRRYEACQLVVGRRLPGRLARRGGRGRGAPAAQQAQYPHRVDAEYPAAHEHQDDAAQAEVDAAEAHAAAARIVTPILDVIALAVVLPAHSMADPLSGL